MQRNKFTFTVHRLPCISVMSINPPPFKHILLLAVSCNELNYSLIITLGKGCIQILRPAPLPPRMQAQQGGTDLWILPFLWWLSQGYYALQCCAHPCQSKEQTLPIPRGIMPSVLQCSSPHGCGRFTLTFNKQWALIERQTEKHILT